MRSRWSGHLARQLTVYGSVHPFCLKCLACQDRRPGPVRARSFRLLGAVLNGVRRVPRCPAYGADVGAQLGAQYSVEVVSYCVAVDHRLWLVVILTKDAVAADL